MGKSKNEERTKKIDENKQNRTFQNQLLRPEIAALDRFDFHLVTGEKVSSHSNIIHSSFQGKTIFCSNSDCLQFLILFFISSSFLLFPDFLMNFLPEDCNGTIS